MLNLKESKKTFRPDGTLAFEFIELPDGTEVSITYDKTGRQVVKRREILPYTEKISKEGKCISRYRKDGTLWLVRECDGKGGWTATEYDKEGKRPLCRVLESKPFSDETIELVKSAELLSKKRLKRHFIQRQRGE